MSWTCPGDMLVPGHACPMCPKCVLRRHTRHSTAWGDEVSSGRLALHTVLLLINFKSWILIIFDMIKLIKKACPPNCVLRSVRCPNYKRVLSHPTFKRLDRSALGIDRSAWGQTGLHVKLAAHFRF